MSLLDDYHLLQVPTTATEQDVKAAFRRLARQYHPDKNPNQDTTELFQRLQAAYQNVLDAIKNGTQPADWQPYSFTNEAKPSPFEKSGFNFKNDGAQEEYIRERQRAYEEMKRNNAKKDQAREEAIKTARNTLNERRVKALYEEAFKHNKPFDSEKNYADVHSNRETHPNRETHHFNSENFTSDSDIKKDTQYQFDEPPFQNQFSGRAGYSNTLEERHDRSFAVPIRLRAAKLAFQAASYIGCFAAGIYATLYWQDLNTSNDQMGAEQNTYIAGLYPDLRIGDAYSLEDTPLYSEPNTSNTSLINIPQNSDVSVQQSKGNWLALRYKNHTGWAKASKFGFGSFNNAQLYGCYGHPGIAPEHGEFVRKSTNNSKKHLGKSRLRILNQLPVASILRFESLEGDAPFAIYLHAKQALAANSIPRGKYKLVLETGSLYHRACQHFVFNDQEHTLMDTVDFSSTERSITLRP
ncbi:J domain-containing protein [Marinomonas balearica]|uniref:DnaJ-like protein n=1 Tax=Marinomonas balearica TaxID=491947 RepID=A0A4V3CH26_9GAMM|nr:J domain-containing protein [Marinomonas balearica]TDO99972.1 DnaJ-like protein [Marinomonas balearica]